jgi:hypothetical protein
MANLAGEVVMPAFGHHGFNRQTGVNICNFAMAIIALPHFAFID